MGKLGRSTATRHRRRSLLFVVSSMAIGGPQKSLLGLLERLDEKAFDVSLLVLDPKKDSLTPFVPANVTLLETPAVITAATLPKDRIAWALCRLLSYLLRQGRVVLPITLVLSLLRDAFAREPGQRIRQRFWARLSGRLPRVEGSFDAAIGILGLSTYVVWDLVDSVYKYHWVRSDSRVLERDEFVEATYFANLTGALSVSSTCEAIFVEKYPHMRGRTWVYKNDIPMGLVPSDVETSCSVYERGVLKVLTVTRLDPLKGLELAVEACAILAGRGVAVCWIVLGEGPQRGAVQAQIDRLGQTDRFILQGAVFDTNKYVDQADLYVHPSRVEGRSNAVEEAKARGKPIIATQYATVRDQLTHGTDGLICGVDSESLADAVERLAADEALRSSLGSRAAGAYMKERADPNWLFEGLAEGSMPQGGR